MAIGGKVGKTKYTKDNLEPIVQSSISYAQVLHYLNLSTSGGNQAHLKSVINKLGIEISHFKGQGWEKGKPSHNRSKPEDYLKEYDKDVSVSTHQIKNWLFRDKIKEKICEECGLTEWQGKPIPLELHHIDGNRHNNKYENIKILCSNCHAQTENYCSKNKL